MKKLITLFILILTFLIPASVCAEESFSLLSEKGIVFGDENGLRLFDNLKRCEFVAIVNRAFELKSADENVRFADVSENDWYYNDFKIAVSDGYLKGNGDMHYLPQDLITRSEAVTIIGRIMGYFNKTETEFTDNANISEWARGPAESLKEYGIISGYPDGSFKPENLITREEAFIILTNVLNKRFEGGDGSEDNPYIINKPYQLFNVRYDISACYAVKADLMFDNMTFRFSSIGSEHEPFWGALNGNGFKITGLYTTDSSKNSLFDTIGDKGRVCGVRIVCPDIFFSLCETNNGTIDDCSNTSFSGNVREQFKKEKGGIAAVNNGIISNCYNSSDVVSRTAGDTTGGIVGDNRGKILRCFNTGTLKSDYTSGISGTNSGEITDCYTTGDVLGKNVRPITDKAGRGVNNCGYIGKTVTNIGTYVTLSGLKKMYTEPEFIFDEELQLPIPQGVRFFGNENFKEFSGGNGSMSNPFVITNAQELLNISLYPESCFVQMSDIDVTQVLNSSPDNIDFKGVYNGNGYSLSGFRKIFFVENGSLLFNKNYGIIQNLNIFDCYAEGKNISVIAGENHGSIVNCNVSAVLKGEAVSGVTLQNQGEIQGCFFDGTITSGEKGAGICVLNYGKTENCLSNAQIFGNTSAGIVYDNSGTVGKSCFFGKLYTSTSAGIAYLNSADIKNCYYTPGYVSTYDNKGRISAVTRDKNQMSAQAAFAELDFDTRWRMHKNYGPVPYAFFKNEIITENTVDFAGGNGSAENPFKLVTPLHINNIRKYPGECFVLMNSIDISGFCAEGGGFYNNGRGFSAIEDFEGVIFGNGHKISGMYQNGENGGFINKNYGIISSLTVEGDITAKNAGVIVNENYGTILYSTSSGKANAFKVGGIAVENAGVITECVNTAKIYASGVGAGIAVHNRTEITNCLNSGEIIGADENAVILGICGGGSLRCCFNTADLYFASPVGEFYPVSDTSYDNCYYIDRYNKKFAGSLNYAQLFDVKNFKNFDFSKVWSSTSAGAPVLKFAGKTDIKLKGVFGGGNGTISDPYLISTPEEFYNIRMYKDSHFKLTGDINLSPSLKTEGLLNNGGRGFEMIDDFYGSLNGNGCTVYGLAYVNEKSENAGLFGVLHGSVYNITFADCRIEGMTNAGIVAGVNYGKISKVSVRNSRVGTYNGVSGGIAGINRNDISDCVNAGDVFSQNSSGGIAGVNYAYISGSSNRGGVLSVTQLYDGTSGGIAGVNEGRISESYNVGNILSYSESYNSYSGGIAGLNKSNILNCYNSGGYNAKGNLCYAGGIAGYEMTTGRVEHTYNSGYGNISGEGNLGALVGGGDGEVSFSYFEHTLPSAAGGDIKSYDVYPVSPQILLSPSGTDFLSSEVWIKDGSLYPQIIGNEHKENELIHNVRDFAGGDGSVKNPYIIMIPEQLDNVRKYLGSAFVLMGDIDMSSYSEKNGFEPVGNNIFGFFGMFMGNGYKITGLKCDGSSLFKQNHGEIYNLKLEGMNVSSPDKYCGIAEINTGLIYQCDVYSDLSGQSGENVFVGGIAGINLKCGMIISSASYGKLSANAQTVHTGGICYGNYGVIAGCMNESVTDVTVGNLGISGGVCAYNYGTISDCSSLSEITVNGGKNTSRIAGGIAGVNGGSIVSSYFSGERITADAVGGICSNPLEGNVLNCYYNNAVYGETVPGAIPCSPEDMFKQETYDGFDFYSMWYMPEGSTPMHIR